MSEIKHNFVKVFKQQNLSFFNKIGPSVQAFLLLKMHMYTYEFHRHVILRMNKIIHPHKALMKVCHEDFTCICVT